MSQVAGHAYMRPDRPALRYLGRTTTWRQLHERSLAFAGALARRGVAAGDRVLVLALNRPEDVEAVFGINSLGAIAVPVNVRLTPPEIAYIVQDSGARVVAAVFGQTETSPITCVLRGEDAIRRREHLLRGDREPAPRPPEDPRGRDRRAPRRAVGGS